MTPLQKLKIEQSQKRERLNALLAKPAEGEGALTAEERAELDGLATRLVAIEPEIRAAMVAEAAATEEADAERRAGANGDGEAAERRQLEREVRCANYLNAAVAMRSVDGREAELNAAVGLPEGMMPFEALAPAEERADATTVAPATTSTVQHPILARVFARTSAAWLGLEMPMVGVGEANFPVFTSGVEAEQVDAGGTTDAVAAVFTPNTVLPKRLQARYRFNVEGQATMMGMESALRADLAESLGEALDKRTVANDLLGANGLTNPANPAAVVTFQTLKDGMEALVDGRYSMATDELRLLVGAATYQKFGKEYLASKAGAQTEEDGNEMLRRRLGGYRVSAHIPAATGEIQPAIVARGTHRAAVVPTWQGVALLRDPYSRANEGEVVVTATMLTGFAMLRQDAAKRVEFKLA